MSDAKASNHTVLLSACATSARNAAATQWQEAPLIQDF
jgi:hypothetical protein